MKKIMLFIFMINFIYSYTLAITKKEELKILKKIGIECKKVRNDFFVCLKDDLNTLRRIKDFLKKKYKIEALIVKDYSNKKKLFVNKKINYKNNLKKEKSIKKSGYCLQLSTNRFLKSAKLTFKKYKNLPFTRIEKIGSFYVVRSGLGSYKDIKKLFNEVKTGYIRKCDLIEERIVLKNFDFYDNFKFDKNLNINKNSIKIKKVSIDSTNKQKSSVIKEKLLKNIQTDDENVGVSLKSLYYYLNNGELKKAEKLAKDLYKKGFKKDALYVLGLSALKKKNFSNSCKYFLELKKIDNSLKVKKSVSDSCSVNYLRYGYKMLQKNPLKAKYYFEKSLKFKNSLDAKIGLVYSYLNSNDLNNAKRIAENLYKKYPNNRKVILLLAQIYNTLEDYDKVKELSKKYPNILKKSKIIFYAKLQQAKDLIDKGNLKEAETILLSLYQKDPSEVNLLLTLGNLYLKLKKLDKALFFYKNVLLLSPNNYYALKGIEGIYLMKGDYNNALEYSNKIIDLGYNDLDKQKIIDALNLKKATKLIKAKKFEKAKEILTHVSDKNPDKYLLLGDIFYNLGDNINSYKYYSKAYALYPNNFDVKLKFLYSLLKLNLFEQIKIILENIDKNKLTFSQKEKLKKFYNVLLLKYAYYLLNEKKYKKALKIAKKGLELSHNYEFYSMIGWSCYNLRDYNCAEKAFQKYLRFNPHDNKVKYGLAFVYYQKDKLKLAKSLLDSIKTADPQLKANIAELYALIGDIKRSNNIIEELENNKNINQEKINYKIKEDEDDILDLFEDNEKSEGKKKEFYKVNKLESKLNRIKHLIKTVSSKRTSNISAGFFYRNKSGNSGTSKLNYFSPFFSWELFKNNIVFYGNIKYHLLNSGNINNYNEIGSAYDEEVNENIVAKFYTLDYGTSGSLGIKFLGTHHIIDILLGATPIGSNSNIPIDYTGHFKYKYFKDLNAHTITLYRRSIKSSLLAFIGDTDPFTGKKWGRVLESGISYEYERVLDKNDSLFYLSLSYSSLDGYNTLSNQKIDFMVFPLWYVGNFLLDKDYLGIYFDVYHYDKDENNFYYKNGGYFSPNIALVIGPRYEGYIGNNSFLLKFMFNPDFYFSDTASANLYVDTGFSGIYLINKRFALESGLDMRFSPDYNDKMFFLNLKYYLGDKFFIFKEDVDKILKKVSKW